MSALKAMIKRELQEHKWGFIYLPWIIGAFMSLVVVLVYLGLTEVNTENIKFSTDVFDNQETVQAMNEATFDQKRAAMRAGLLVLGFPLVIALGFAILAYSLSTFFDERKDKSIVFWRSLPVSDSFTVISKLMVALVVAPLLVIPGSHKNGLIESKLHEDAKKDGGYALHHIDNNTLENLANESTIEPVMGPAGSVAFVICTLVHGSGNNVSPWRRAILYMNYNTVSNACTEASRPWFQNNRDFTPLKSLDDDCLTY